MCRTIIASTAVAVGLLITMPQAHADAGANAWVVTVSPDAGRDTVPSMKPGWCDLVTKAPAVRGVSRRNRFSRSGRSGRAGRSGRFGNRAPSGRSSGPSTSYVRRGMNGAKRAFYAKYTTSIATGLCANPDDAAWQLQTGYFVQMYVNLTGLKTKQAVAAIRARLQSKSWTSQRKAFCGKLTVGDEASPAQTRRNDARRKLFACGGDGNEFWRDPSVISGKKLEWDLDKREHIDSEAMKAYYVLGCFEASRSATIADKSSLLPYAVCGVDARSLSSARLEKQLAGGNHNTYSRTYARETFASAQAATMRMKALADQLAKRDPTYKKLLQTIPAAAWNKWKATYAANKSAFDAAHAFEKVLYGPSKSALKGCLAPLRKHLGDHLRKTKPRTVKALELVLRDTVSSTLIPALMPCAAVDSNPWEAATYRKLWDKTGPVRGPRYAAYYAIVSEIVNIRKDRSRFPLTARSLFPKHSDSPYSKYSHLAKSVQSQEGFGIVRTIKTVRGGIKLTFKKVRWQEDMWECRSTGKIWRVDSDGEVKYHTNCVSKGKEWRTKTEKPIIIPAYAVQGIKRGSFVELHADYPFTQANYRRFGFPLRVYKSKKKKKLVAAYGYKL